MPRPPPEDRILHAPDRTLDMEMAALVAELEDIATRVRQLGETCERQQSQLSNGLARAALNDLADEMRQLTAAYSDVQARITNLRARRNALGRPGL